MRNDRIVRVALLAGATTLCGIILVPRAAAQEMPSNTNDALADAARKAREEQKTAPKPKKVFTNDDMPANPADTTSATVKGGDATAAQGGGDNGAEADNDPKSEKYWRKKFKASRDKLALAEKDLDVLQRELDKNQVQYYNDPQKALMQEYNRSDIAEKTARIDAKKKEIEGLKQRVSDMEDDLRKAGGDPGWAR